MIGVTLPLPIGVRERLRLQLLYFCFKPAHPLCISQLHGDIAEPLHCVTQISQVILRWRLEASAATWPLAADGLPQLPKDRAPALVHDRDAVCLVQLEDRRGVPLVCRRGS